MRKNEKKKSCNRYVYHTKRKSRSNFFLGRLTILILNDTPNRKDTSNTLNKTSYRIRLKKNKIMFLQGKRMKTQSLNILKEVAMTYLDITDFMEKTQTSACFFGIPRNGNRKNLI